MKSIIFKSILAIVLSAGVGYVAFAAPASDKSSPGQGSATNSEKCVDGKCFKHSANRRINDNVSNFGPAKARTGSGSGSESNSGSSTKSTK